jgi:hypothetical protein
MNKKYFHFNMLILIVKIHKTIILPVVLYGCETWSLTLREEHRVRVSENKVLWRIFGPKRDEVTGEWRKLHNEELHNFYSSPDIIRQVKSRRMRWAGHVARIAEERNVYKVQGSEWILGRWAGGVWIGSSWLRIGAGGGGLVNTVMNLRVLAPRNWLQFKRSIIKRAVIGKKTTMGFNRHKRHKMLGRIIEKLVIPGLRVDKKH